MCGRLENRHTFVVDSRSLSLADQSAGRLQVPPGPLSVDLHPILQTRKAPGLQNNWRVISLDGFMFPWLALTSLSSLRDSNSSLEVLSTEAQLILIGRRSRKIDGYPQPRGFGL